MALNLGNRGQRVPDWHLDPLKHELIQAILKLSRGADPWQVYHALLQPRAMLHGRSALDGVTATNSDRLVVAVSATVKESEWSPHKARPPRSGNEGSQPNRDARASVGTSSAHGDPRRVCPPQQPPASSMNVPVT